MYFYHLLNCRFIYKEVEYTLSGWWFYYKPYKLRIYSDTGPHGFISKMNIEYLDQIEEINYTTFYITFTKTEEWDYEQLNLDAKNFLGEFQTILICMYSQNPKAQEEFCSCFEIHKDSLSDSMRQFYEDIYNSLRGIYILK